MKEAPTTGRRIESVLTALPILMVVAGLYFYYSGEKKQVNSEPIMEESVTLDVKFEGFSSLRSGGEGQHFLWYLGSGTSPKGARLTLLQLDQMEKREPPLIKGEAIRLKLAPRVSGSRTLWVVELNQ